MTCHHTNMQPGIALQSTLAGIPDFAGDNHATTASPGGPGRLIDCFKCADCGYSVTISNGCFFDEAGERDALALSANPDNIAPPNSAL